MIVDPNIVEPQSFRDIGKLKDDPGLAEWATSGKGQSESVLEPATWSVWGLRRTFWI
jgi:hypothetical protein